MIMRKDNQAKLMIKCPNCNNEINEYNWTLKTAARFSIGEDTCPTFIMVLLEAVKGNPETFDGYRLICPKCYYGTNFEDLTLPDHDNILKYAEAVGEEYCKHWY